MKFKKDECLVLFAILDAFLLGRFMTSVFSPYLPTEAPLWYQTLCILRPFFLLSLGASAFGLATKRKWAFILSYVQFPLRFALMLLSFGILAPVVTSIFQSSRLYQPMMILAMVLEGLRLVMTVLIHRRITKG